ncbi:MAG: hypothetical protein DRO67_00635 [Candidatus Asgardarchaeum californiense]|nr:MAG: hypothetical protein DRO67_00635 [Candidatus Asgardarchaeum californiense]
MENKKRDNLVRGIEILNIFLGRSCTSYSVLRTEDYRRLMIADFELLTSMISKLNKNYLESASINPLTVH